MAAYGRVPEEEQPGQGNGRVPEEEQGLGNERAGALADLRGWDRERAKAWERDTELLLRERAVNRRRGGGQVELPTHLTVSSLVILASDPKTLARQVRRPVPEKPTPLDVEVPFETVIADRLVRGRMDAVFELSDGRYEVVDQVSAAFRFVRLNETVRPVNLLDERGLIRLIESIPAHG
ncbi:hypothetical protein FHR32_001701 [Streptosporangium album]|uniref:Uncharacterized protein n=1 Tax=Streptosporangium album TaxID=47479 RepID=A0A7W7W837_9ACTN|nr:hypothetical protein [Streptosporangium album]